MSIQSDLKNLSPRNSIKQSKRLKPERVDALAVNKADRALLFLKGKPTERSRWWIDPVFWGLASNVVTRH